MQITVIGLPAPQGSKSFKGIHGGHAVLAESSKRVKPWREAVLWAARELHHPALPQRAVPGPVRAEMIFTVPKPKRAPKYRRTWPDRKPDLSKLVRSTEDALTDAGIWDDDARVVEYGRVAKVFPGEDPDALDVPGAVIRIEAVEAVVRAAEKGRT